VEIGVWLSLLFSMTKLLFLKKSINDNVVVAAGDERTKEN
jgi:hypothetical protein